MTNHRTDFSSLDDMGKTDVKNTLSKFSIEMSLIILNSCSTTIVQLERG